MIMLYFYQRNIIAGRDFIVPLTFCSVSARSRAIFGNEAMNYKDDRSAVNDKYTTWQVEKLYASRCLKEPEKR